MQDSKSSYINKELILERKEGLMTFAHITYTDVVPKIVEHGFISGDGNLGIGVYCCDLERRKSVKALVDFHKDLTEGEDEMCIIVGTYNGERLECIDSTSEYQEYNEGFVLLKDTNLITVSQIYTVLVADIKKTLERLELQQNNNFKKGISAGGYLA